MGTVSRVPRDDLTLMRLFGGITCELRLRLGLPNFSFPVGNLSKTPADIAPTWLDYVAHQIGVLCDMTALVTARGELDNVALVRFLRDCAGAERAALIGPPPRLLEASVTAERSGLTLPASSYVVALGGWKTSSGDTIERTEFDDRVASGFGIAPVMVRDAYSMVELNSVLFECAEKRLHIPSWLRVHALDPRTGQATEPGTAGVLRFWDPTAVSYPAFIHSDDFGVVRTGCGCGDAGGVVEVLGRVNRTEGRGCATKYDAAQKGGRR
jgi:long-chain-fatty-acid---luciferin-component ligase